MLLNTVKNEDFASNIETKKFVFEMNSMAFYAVINGIYADKIKSPMRELATNARDGHALAGKLDVPFDIKLPTQFNPVFSVRDYGCSMTHDEIMGLYSTMFASSKRNSNEAVGMIGLGSKSPFSYVNQFTVTAWQDGVRRDYVASIGQDDEPEIGLLASVPSDEPTGVEVTIAVKLEDIATFKAAANEVFFGFDPKPNIENFTFPEVASTYKGDGYTLYAEGAAGWPFQKRAYARQGCVIYPIDPSALGPRFKDNPIWGMPIIVDFPIGQLSVNTSREALGYDTMTVNNIEARMKVVLDDMTNIVQKEVDAQPRYIDACVLFEKSRATNVIYKTLGGTLKWRKEDELLRFKFAKKNRDDAGTEYSIRRYTPTHQWVGKVGASVSFPQIKTATTVVVFPDEVAKAVMIFDIADEKLEQVPSRARRAFFDAKDKYVYWVKAKDRVTATSIWNALGRPDIVELKDTVPLTIARQKSGGSRLKDYRVFVTLRPSTLGNELVDISEDVVIPYLYNDNQMVYFRDEAPTIRRSSPTRRDSMYRTTKEMLDLIKSTDKIETPYVFNAGFKQRLVRMPKVQPIQFHEYFLGLMKAEGLDMNVIAKYCNDRDVTAQRMPTSYRSYEHNRLLSAAKVLKAQKKWMPPELAKFVEKASLYDQNKNIDHFEKDPMNPWYGLRHNLRQFYPAIFSDARNAGEVNKALVETMSNDDTALYSLVVRNYPLINVAIQNTTNLEHYMELLQK